MKPVHLILLLALITCASAEDYVPGQSYFGVRGFVEYIPGDSPVILTAPHGGGLLA